MKNTIVCVGFCLLFSFLSFGKNEFVEPTEDFSANFCNFPHAWSIANGKGVKIGIVHTNTAKVVDWISKLSGLAPESEFRQIEKGEFLSSKSELFSSHIILLHEQFEENEYQDWLNAIKTFTQRGVAVVIPAYFGPLKKNYNYHAWRQFIKKASQNNAIIAGAHGSNYQLGDLSFWKSLPIDIYALNARIQGDAYSKPDAIIDVNIEDSVYLVGAAAALLKSKTSEVSPAQLKQTFRERGRKVNFVYINIEYEIEGKEKKERINLSPKLSKESIAHDSKYKVIKRQIEKYKKDNPGSYLKVEEVIDFEFSCLDAALIMGLKPMGNGEWACQVLNVIEAQKIATGKDITVAILDHMFEKEDKSLQNRLIKPGSVLEGAPVFDPKTGPGHGTWMAQVLVRVAPDVKIMPVRICGNGSYGDADLYIKGIQYAVKNGADIISLSHQAIHPERQADLDSVIEQASRKGVTIVYINYRGQRGDVIVPCPIEFANKHNKNRHVFVVGTNFISESSFPYTWGVSQTAPIVAGVTAMLKELNPELTPIEIKKILLESNNIISSGYPMLDAFKALEGLQNRSIR